VIESGPLGSLMGGVRRGVLVVTGMEGSTRKLLLTKVGWIADDLSYNDVQEGGTVWGKAGDSGLFW
jgi:hypothetical protein